MEKVTLEDLKDLAAQAKGEVDTIFLHWTAGHYGQFFNDYHILIDFDGSIYVSTFDFTTLKAHTWRHNTGAIGVAVCCNFNANTDDFGPEPLTEAQIECLSQVIATLCDALEIPIRYANVRTHAEQADEDDYGPATTCERWDLWMLRPEDEAGSGGDILRGKAIFYLNGWEMK